MVEKSEKKESDNFSSKRRDLIKTGLLGLGASAVALSGCDKNENTSELNIIPKQTEIYSISYPMLFNFRSIDNIAECNKKFKKSKITTLYNSVPWPQIEKYNQWFMMARGINSKIKTYKDFDKYVQYSIDKGFEVVYLMNSPKAFNDRDIEPFKKDFYKLLDNLWNSGIRKIKFANTQVAQLINEYNPEFKLSVAMTLEYSSISQYRALFELFPNIVHTCVPKDLNQNFRFLASLRKAFPEVEIEVVCEEGCFKWCPSRLFCMSSMFSPQYKLGCNLMRANWDLRKVLSGLIYPWDLGYYSAIGINSFKLLPMGRKRAKETRINNLTSYLSIVEHGFKSSKSKKSMQYLYDTKVPDKFVAALPKIEHFVHHGHECIYKCKSECTYCFDCMENLKKIAAKKQNKI